VWVLSSANPLGARATDLRNGGKAGYTEKGAEGSSAATGGTATEAAGAGGTGASRATAICCAQRPREGEVIP
jgi:hypothetical protein